MEILDRKCWHDGREFGVPSTVRVGFVEGTFPVSPAGLCATTPTFATASSAKSAVALLSGQGRAYIAVLPLLAGRRRRS